MRTSWPFVGRAVQLDTLRTACAGPAARGIVVAGAAGVGKSRLTAEAVRPLGAPLLRAAATQASAAIPLGVFAHLLPPAPPPGGNTLRWAADAIRAASQGVPILFVDDAHLLDRVSAALLHHLVAERTARVIATVRSGAPPPDPVLALWKDELLPRLELGPLSVAETSQVLAAALGGPVEEVSVRRLARLTRGNALFLREVVLALLAAGTLTETRGIWSWQGELPVGGRLRELIEVRLGSVEPAEQEVLDLVAFGEPLDAALLGALTSVDAVMNAEAKHLVTATDAGRRLWVRLAHPLYGEVARARTGPLRARRLLGRLADAVAASGRTEDALRIAVWRLESGVADPAALTAGCRLAWAAYDLQLAERLGRAALDAGAGLEAALVLGAVLHFADRPEDADAVLGEYGALASTDRERALYVLARAPALNWDLGRQPDAYRLVDEVAAAIEDPAWRQEVLVHKAVFHTFSARCEQALHELAEVRALGPPTYRTAAHIATVEALTYAFVGRTGDSLAAADTALADAGRWGGEFPNVVVAVMCARTMAAIFAADLDLAAEFAAAGYHLVTEDASWDAGIVGFSSLRAQAARLRGDLDEAFRLCRDGGLRVRGSAAGFAGTCYGELAYVAGQMGDVATAHEALEAADQHSLPTFRAVNYPMPLARPWLHAARGDLAAAQEAAQEVAAELEECGLHSALLFALHDLIRLGAAREPARRTAERLGRLSATTDSQLAPLFARHATAVAVRDAAGLDAVGKDFEHRGLLLFAAEATAQAARLHRALDRDRGARSCEARAAKLARQCPGARTPALRDLMVPELTTRQRQVADLAVTGLSNAEIAERLVLSRRTVANHLCAVYEKLGVSDRAGLAERLR